MKVMRIFDSDYPWEIRDERICKGLINNGYKVDLVCANLKGFSRTEEVDGIAVSRMPPFSLLPSGFRKIFAFPFGFNPVWYFFLKSQIKEKRPDLIIVRDLPLVLAAIRIGRKYNIPVILDMAEPYPEFLRLLWKYEPFRFQNYFIRNPVFAEMIEKYAMKKVEHTFVVSEETKVRLIEKYKVSEDKITIVGNTPIIENYLKYEPVKKETDDEIIINYTGMIGYSRGLDIAIKAIPKLKKKFKTVKLVLAGTGTADEDLKLLADKLGVNSEVEFKGFIPHKDAMNEIMKADIGILPFHRCAHMELTIANKIYEYMLMEKAVLASDMLPMVNIINKHKCGRTFKAGDIDSFVNAVVELRDPNIRATMGASGRKAVLNEYNWTEDTERMVSTVNNILAN